MNAYSQLLWLYVSLLTWSNLKVNMLIGALNPIFKNLCCQTGYNIHVHITVSKRK